MKQEIQMLIGNIASGKSTYCKGHINQFVVLSCDALRYMIGAGQYIYNINLEYVLRSTILQMYVDLQPYKCNIMIDETNVSVSNRKLFIDKKSLDYTITAIIFPKLSMEESIRRRLGDNHGQTNYDVWKRVWTSFNQRFEVPTFKEGFDKIIRI